MTDDQRKREREERVLFSYWRSSCSYRVRIVLNFKGLEYVYKPVHLLKGEDLSPEYFNMNPAGVPTLLDGGNTFTQSLAIIEYLEERYPEKSILPRAFEQRAHARAIANEIACLQPLVNLGTQQKIGKLAGDEAKAKWAKDAIDEGLEAIEILIAQTAGKFCVGDQFTIADACLVPQLYTTKRFSSFDPAKFPTIAKVLQNLEELPFVSAAHPDRMPDAVKA
jgi:maleylacetoacetate isomerase